ncbi:MAG: hypothetical protein A3J63_02280 [Candidatus Moranbacteria bacterium RIFCSPHIGHO2_02_FULL_40_12b]|nr:MAG: hypothetical protein A3J63_02280 [Candidatus Moranbacteria bacterium RIFCSPHIGHO2_02_FULL_40_12b]
MNYQHKNLAGGRWNELPFFEQMANVGSEVERTIKWKDKNAEFSRMAFERALELLDLSLSDKKNIKRLREIARVREAIVDYFAGANEYASSDESWRKYFYAFNYAARLGR